MTEGKWALPEDRVKRIEDLQKEIAELEKPDNGEMKDLPLKTMATDVIDVAAKQVPVVTDQYMERIGATLESVAVAMRSGHFMVAVFTPYGEDIKCNCHRHDLANGVMTTDEALEMTMSAMRRAIYGETPQTVKPLPRAVVKRPKPAEVLFGKTQEDKDGD